MAAWARKDDLDRVRELADKRIAARRKRPDGSIVARPDDDAIMLMLRGTSASLIGNWAFFAARFADAADCWRAQRALDRPPSPDTPPEVARLVDLRAWRVGDLDRLRDHLEVESALEDRAIFLNPSSWRLAGLRPPDAWWKRWRENFDVRLREHHRAQHRGPAREIAEAIEVDEVVARGLFWLGETGEAHVLLERVLAATVEWETGRVRLWSDESPDVRAAYLGSTRALHALTHPGVARPAEGVAHARAALLGCMRSRREGNFRHEDLPLIHVIAVARSQPQAAEVVEFRTHLPWLAHLLE